MLRVVRIALPQIGVIHVGTRRSIAVAPLGDRLRHLVHCVASLGIAPLRRRRALECQRNFRRRAEFLWVPYRGSVKWNMYRGRKCVWSSRPTMKGPFFPAS